MTVKLSVTQCTLCCPTTEGRRGKLVLRLNDSALSASGVNFLEVNVESVTPDSCTGRTTYLISYDETLLADPGSYLTADDFTLVCVDVGDEYAVEQAKAGIAGDDIYIESITDAGDAETDGIYTVTLNKGQTFTIDLSKLLDDTTVTYQLTYGPADSQITLVGSDGNDTTLDLCSIVRECETVTTFVYDGGLHTLTYTDEDGGVHVVDLNVSAITDTVDGHLIATHTAADGTEVEIDETVTSLAVVAGDLVYTDESGATTTIPMVEDELFTITGGPDATTVESGPIDINNHDNIHFWPGNSIEVEVTPGSGRVEYGLVLSADAGQLLDFGTDDNILLTKEMVPLTELELVGSELRYTDELGVVTPIDLCPAVGLCETVTTISYDELLNRVSYTDEAGVITVLDLSDLDNTSEITNTVVGSRIATHDGGDGTLVDIFETVTSIAYDAILNRISYTDEAGVIAVLDLADLNDTSVITNTVVGSRIATHDDGDGTLVDIFETDTVLVDNGNSTFTYTNEAGVASTVDFSETVTDLQINPTTTGLLYTNEDGQIQDLDLCPIVESCETVTTLSYDATTDTLTYTPEDGAATSIVLNDTKSTVTNTVLPGQRIATHDNGDGTVVDINETISTLVDNGNSSFTHVSEDGTSTTVDFSETVTDLQINPTTTGLVYTDEDGQAQDLDLCPIVDNCETVTVLAYDAVADTLTYTDEDGAATTLVLNDTKSVVTNVIQGNRIATHSNGDGTLVDIDETITVLTDNGNDSFTYTDEEGVATVVDFSETLTTIAYNGATGDLTYIDENGNPTVINIPTENFLAAASYNDPTNELTLTLTDGTTFTVDLSDLVDPNIVTTLSLVGNTLQYVNEAGTIANIDLCPVVESCETVTSIALTAAGVINYTDEDGTVTALDLCPAVDTCETVTGIALTAAGVINYTDEDGTVTALDLCPAVAECETVTSIALTAAGVLNYTDEDGTVTALDLCPAVDTCETVTSIALTAAGVLNYTDEDGTVTALDLCPAVDTCETVTGIALTAAGVLNYTDEDGTVTALDLCPAVVECETLTTIVDNGDDTFTYTNEAGVAVIVDYSAAAAIPPTVTNVIAGNRIATHNDGYGTVVEIDESITTLVDSAAANTFTYTNEVGVPTVVDYSGNPSALIQTVIAGNQIGTHDDGDGTVTPILETVTTLTDNGDGTLTYLNESGVPVIIDFSENLSSFTQTVIVGNQIGTHNDGAGVVVPVLETVTTLTDNGDGTFTYQNEAGAATVLDFTENLSVMTQTVVAGNQIGTHNDGSGVVVPLFETVTSLAVVGDTLTYTDEAGAVTSLDLCVNVANCETVTEIVDNADGTFTYTDEAGADTTLTYPTDGFVFTEATGLGVHTAVDGTVETFNTVSADVGNIISIGANGGANLTCDDVNDCIDLPVRAAECASGYFVGSPV